MGRVLRDRSSLPSGIRQDDGHPTTAEAPRPQQGLAGRTCGAAPQRAHLQSRQVQDCGLRFDSWPEGCDGRRSVREVCGWGSDRLRIERRRWLGERFQATDRSARRDSARVDEGAWEVDGVGADEPCRDDGGIRIGPPQASRRPGSQRFCRVLHGPEEDDRDHLTRPRACQRGALKDFGADGHGKGDVSSLSSPSPHVHHELIAMNRPVKAYVKSLLSPIQPLKPRTDPLSKSIQSKMTEIDASLAAKERARVSGFRGAVGRPPAPAAAATTPNFSSTKFSSTSSRPRASRPPYKHAAIVTTPALSTPLLIYAISGDDVPHRELLVLSALGWTSFLSVFLSRTFRLMLGLQVSSVALQLALVYLDFLGILVDLSWPSFATWTFLGSAIGFLVKLEEPWVEIEDTATKR